MSSSLDATMKAWHCARYEEDPSAALAEQLSLNEAVPVPIPGRHQVLVRVQYASVNPFDVQLLRGVYALRFPITSFPFVPGLDAAGEVAALGPGCSRRLRVGDRVVLCFGPAECSSGGSAFGPGGALAEFCACPEGQVAKVPDGLGLSAVAGLPLAGLSAYQALFTGHAASTRGEALGDVSARSMVLVLGGDRGAGHLAVQLAKRVGATVVTTASPSRLDWLRALGADRVVDWRAQDWTEQLTGLGFDLVYDCVGWAGSPEEMGRATRVMRPGGQFIATPDFEAFAPEGVLKTWNFKSLVAKPSAEDLDVLLRRVAAGELEVHVSKIYPFEEAHHALAHSIRGQTTGKVLVSVGVAEATAPGNEALGGA